MANNPPNSVDALRAIILHELETRRPEIEANAETLVSVGMVVKLDKRGVPRLVIWRPEYHRDFAKSAK